MNVFLFGEKKSIPFLKNFFSYRCLASDSRYRAVPDSLNRKVGFKHLLAENKSIVTSRLLALCVIRFTSVCMPHSGLTGTDSIASSGWLRAVTAAVVWWLSRLTSVVFNCGTSSDLQVRCIRHE